MARSPFFAPSPEAICTSRSFTALSAASRSSIPGSVRPSAIRRRSSSLWVRATRPRATRPSMTAVTLGGRTASRSASEEDMAEPSASRLRMRYWERDRSTEASPSSTCLAIHAAVRPGLWTWDGASSCSTLTLLGYLTDRPAASDQRDRTVTGTGRVVRPGDPDDTCPHLASRREDEDEGPGSGLPRGGDAVGHRRDRDRRAARARGPGADGLR